MHYTGPVYRPPFEAKSLLLEVTAGCSHNSCAFCTMYRDVPFSVSPLEQVEADLCEAAKRVPYTTRVFLENGDPFVLSTDKLLKIAELIHKHLPRVETIAMYASVNNIKSKKQKELELLRAAGINELNIGVESGLDEALLRLNKGYTADEAVREFLRLKEAGMDYGANIILGAGGSGQYLENAQETAGLLNAMQPYLIFTGTIHADPGCPLYDDLASGRFTENTTEQYFAEEETLLELLTVQDCLYLGFIHPILCRCRGSSRPTKKG